MKIKVVMVFSLIVLTGLLFPPVSSFSGAVGDTMVAAPQRFLHENLSYDIAFLWFDRLAEGKLIFAETGVAGQYRATLEAKTLGVAGWLTSDRIQHYATLMESLPGGGFRPLAYESHVVKGKGAKRVSRDTRYNYDYRNKVVRLERKSEGHVKSVEELAMGDGPIPNDFLTAFFNFRLGVYGALHEGSHYSIPTITRKGRADIRVDILPSGDRPAKVLLPPGGMLARAYLDPEILDTGGGAVYAWFDEHGRPARAVVENVLGLGDVRGILR